MAGITKAIQRNGTVNWQGEPLRAVNRSGGTIVKGDVMALDITNSEAASPAMLCMNNVVAVSAGNIDGRICVVVSETAADDEDVLVVVSGPVMAKVDGGTLDVVGGDKLIATAASKNFTRSDATTDVVWARALEGNTGSAALKAVYLQPAPTSPGTDESP